LRRRPLGNNHHARVARPITPRGREPGKAGKPWPPVIFPYDGPPSDWDLNDAVISFGLEILIRRMGPLPGCAYIIHFASQGRREVIATSLHATINAISEGCSALASCYQAYGTSVSTRGKRAGRTWLRSSSGDSQCSMRLARSLDKDSGTPTNCTAHEHQIRLPWLPQSRAAA
jgi:hypothetical protein